MPTSIGLNVWSRLVDKTFPYLDQVVEPFESIWFPDHVQYGEHNVAEGWTLLAYALARYPDKICGHDVLCNSFRNPALLAKMAATAQVISGGRVVLGIGAGWNEEEYSAYGFPFPSARVRIEEMAEAIQICRALWTDAPATFHGKHFTVENAYCQPLPNTLPPVMVGGAGERYTLRVVAEHADWWNYVYHDSDAYAHKQRVLQEHCREVGREYGEIQQVLHFGVLIAESEAELERLRTSDDVRPTESNSIIGTPEQVTDRLHALVAEGADRFTMHFADAPRVAGTQLFAQTVLPQFS